VSRRACNAVGLGDNQSIAFTQMGEEIRQDRPVTLDAARLLKTRSTSPSALILASWVSELQIGGGNEKIGNKVSFAAVTGALR
jgi:hypothetical protein